MGKMWTSNFFLLFCVILSISLVSVRTQDVEEYFIDPGVVLVEEWEGWGTSLAWWADMLGGMNDEVFEHVMDAFFNPNKLNFNIIRYVIGGTTPNDVIPYPCEGTGYREGAASESFLDGPGQEYKWDRDPRQIKVLKRSIELGANILEAFSNSPPQWMTISGCAKGNPLRFPLHDNFPPGRSAEFSKYIADVLNHFRTELGITFDYFSPFNEPMGLEGIGSWDGVSSTQEGCNMNRSTMVEVLKVMHGIFEKEGILNYTTITAADETQINTAISTADYYKNEGVDKLITKWNVHGYWDVPRFMFNRRDVLNKIAFDGGQKLWLDEMGWPSTPLSDMSQAFDFARRCMSDLRNMFPSAWVYWQAMEGTDGWGLIRVPYRFDAKLEEIEYSSGFYGMMQFSKYIRQGSSLIYNNDPEAATAFERTTNSVVIVIVHERNETTRKSFDLRRFAGDKKLFNVTRTSSTSQNEDVTNDGNAVINENGDNLLITLSPNSITTVVIGNAFLGTENEENLLQNGDFEGQGAWEVSEGEGNFIGATEFPWRGEKHGFLSKKNNYWNESWIQQELSVEEDSQFYLSLFASTKLEFSSVQAIVNNETVAETWLDPRPSYRMYGLSFQARKGNSLALKIRSGSGAGPVHVDNVRLVRGELREGIESGTDNMRISFGSICALGLSLFSVVLRM